jgi:hypothetical protein
MRCYYTNAAQILHLSFYNIVCTANTKFYKKQVGINSVYILPDAL